MKALVYTGAHALDYREVPDPVPGPGEVLVRVEAVGICGSDMHGWAGHDPRRVPPLILGHEAAGTVAGTGRRVTVNPLVTCGRCAACRTGRENICPDRQLLSIPPREGAFAGLVAVPEGNLVDIPEGVTAQAAALAEPIACGWHAARLAQRVLPVPVAGARCLVLGGGAIGLGAALVLSAWGARGIWIAETNAARRAVVARAGEFRVFDPTGGGGPAPGTVDLVIDGVGYEPTRAAACAAVAPGGAIVHIGLGSASGGVDVRRLTLQEITFIGTYTYTMQDFRETAAAIFDGRLGALDWAEARPLAEGAGAFADISAGRAAAPKITLMP